MVRSFFRPAALLILLVAGGASPADAQQAPPAAARSNTAPNAQEQQVDDFLSRAIVQHKAGDLLGAIQNYKQALALAPDRPDIHSNLGAALIGIGQFADGLAEYRTALDHHDDPAIRLNLALALYKAGRIDDAIPEFQRVLQADPANKQAPLLLGDCLLQAGRDKEVIELLAPRDADYPDDLAYAYILGTALLQTNQTDKGQVLIDRIFRKGESAEGYLLMGMAYLNKRDYPNALTQLQKAVALNPQLHSLQVLYARALLGTSHRAEALAALRTAVEQDPDDFQANLQLGTLYRLDRKFDLALTYLNRAAQVRPDDLALRQQLGATYLGLGDAEKSRVLLEGVVKEVPDEVDAHVLLATAYYRLKRKEDGDRERTIIERLNAENQAKQPGAMKTDELDRATAPAAPASAPPEAPAPQPRAEGSSSPVQ